jgi:STE24 endopeptidase
VKLGYQKELAKSLIKLQIQNLSTMDADWLYASYHYSHPILPERLGALGWSTSSKSPVGNGKVVEVVDEEKPARASGRDEL